MWEKNGATWQISAGPVYLMNHLLLRLEDGGVKNDTDKNLQKKKLKKIKRKNEKKELVKL